LANLYQVLRRAASAQNLSFPYAGKDSVHHALAYSQPYGLAKSRERSFFSERPHKEAPLTTAAINACRRCTRRVS
jgi:hypothetical protein